MKILIAGCSFTENTLWPDHLFSGHQTNNCAKAAAGNLYIANSILHNLDYKPDFVFVLWSGINRIDLRVPNCALFNGTRYRSVELGSSRFLLGGADANPEKAWIKGYNDIKDSSWPDISSLEEWFNLPDVIKLACLDHKIYLSSHGGDINTDAYAHNYFLTQCLDNYKEYRSELSFQNIALCFAMLEKHGVPYRFSFIYDIWNPDEYRGHGLAVKTGFYHMIDWSKFIDFPPYQYGIKHDLLSDDQYHLTQSGMILWSDEIKKHMIKDQELQFLF